MLYLRKYNTEVDFNGSSDTSLHTQELPYRARGATPEVRGRAASAPGVGSINRPTGAARPLVLYVGVCDAR